MKRIARGIGFINSFGLINALLTILNRRLITIAAQKEFEVKGTSITDSSLLASYPTMCALAATDELVFHSFRKSAVLVEALDHVSIQQGSEYLQEVIKLDGWNENTKKVIENIDSIGRPNKFRFSKFGTFSPTLLRYLKVFLEIEKEIGPLKNKSIAEIGVGFGGQASLICMMTEPLEYTLYDIPPVLELVKRFVTELDVYGNFVYKDGRRPSISDPDIVISNYAFSELSKSIQEKYLNNVILRSKSGYITWNCLSANKLNGYTLAELVRLIPNSEILPERPYTHDGNAIIVWK
jgi:hypothetical protein